MGKSEENKIGLFGATAYLTCTIIGSGIFVSPKGILEHAGSIGLSLTVWILCAVIALIVAMSYIELATSIPECGSDFSYINYVGWRPLAFAFLWLSNIIEGSCSCAILFMTFGKYIAEALKPLNENMSDESRFRLEQCLGFIVCLSLAWVNFFSLKKWAARIQITMMGLKFLALAIIIVTGFYFLIVKGKTENFTGGALFNGSSWNAGHISLAIYSGSWAYSGYDALNYGTEEIELKNFAWILPRAVFGGLTMASIIYLLANISYFTILNPQALLDSDAVATTFSEKTLGSFRYAMPAIVGFLMVGSVNSDIFQWSRFTMAGARKSFMPTMLALSNPETDSPRVSVLFHVFLAMAFSFVKDVDSLLNYVNVASMLRQACAMGALIYIKYRRLPVSDTAIKFPIFMPIIAFVICVTLIVVPFVQDILESSISCGLLILCFALYFVFIWPRYRSPFLQWLDEKSTIFCQHVFSCVVEEDVNVLDFAEGNEGEDDKLIKF
ncbi:unnamed protein product, partial [Mesorhabditis belari]|uniref:Uncharacterized protein n=1 Tax=Mesorhabditis belari TaxID=2138241 RepID=A0AAF3FR98_9BILA